MPGYSLARQAITETAAMPSGGEVGNVPPGPSFHPGRLMTLAAASRLVYTCGQPALSPDHGCRRWVPVGGAVHATRGGPGQGDTGGISVHSLAYRACASQQAHYTKHWGTSIQNAYEYRLILITRQHPTFVFDIYLTIKVGYVTDTISWNSRREQC